MLDVLLIAVLRVWFGRDGNAPTWWDAEQDPVVGPALLLVLAIGFAVGQPIYSGLIGLMLALLAASCDRDANAPTAVAPRTTAQAFHHGPDVRYTQRDFLGNPLVSEVLPTGAWRCRLRNGGPAVPRETLARAFEIFFSTKPGAAGLGLAICQRIVEAHGGTVVLESASDVGTTLTIVLPPAA